MGAPRITPDRWRRFDKLISEGYDVKNAALKIGVSYSAARAHVQGRKNSSGKAYREAKVAAAVGAPTPYGSLKPEARRAWGDFEYFRRRYLGHLSTPWQVEAANTIVRLLEQPEKNYVVISCPPGVGKTTLVHDIAAWVTVRHRGIRGMIGSGTQGKATKMLGRLQRTFTHEHPIKAEEQHVRWGLAVDAEATLSQDFGLFKPVASDTTWRRDGFIVAQPPDRPLDQKEYTWAAVGLDQDFLGDRCDFIVWDDAEEYDDIATVERATSIIDRFNKIAETRLEPGGVLLLVGQRLGSNDIYRACLDKVSLPDDDDEWETLDAMTEEERTRAIDDLPRKYRQIIFPAHDESKCEGKATHRRDSEPWPNGCLLDPRRLPWSELRSLAHDDPGTYAVSYQQEDADSADTLIHRAWVEGGTDPSNRMHYPGVRDTDRGLCELPAGVTGRVYSLATVDPSPSKFWSVQWYLYCPDFGDRLFLMDLLRGKMTADDILRWDIGQSELAGVMVDWQNRSRDLGWPITHWIIEAVAAQKWLVESQQANFFRSAYRGVTVTGHQTNQNKNDPKFGVYSVRSWWTSGALRLPYGTPEARMATNRLTDEAVRYPRGMTDDQVMAHWFAIYNLPRIAVPRGQVIQLPGVPRWIRERALA